MALTGDRIHAVRKMTPLVWSFFNKATGNDIPMADVARDLAALFQSNAGYYVSGFKRYEVFSLGNVEGVRVSYANAFDYFPVKSEGK